MTRRRTSVELRKVRVGEAHPLETRGEVLDRLLQPHLRLVVRGELAEEREADLVGARIRSRVLRTLTSTPGTMEATASASCRIW